MIIFSESSTAHNKVWLFGEGLGEAGVENDTLRVVRYLEVILERIFGGCVCSRNLCVVTMLTGFHWRRTVSFSLIYMAIVETDSLSLVRQGQHKLQWLAWLKCCRGIMAS